MAVSSFGIYATKAQRHQGKMKPGHYRQFLSKEGFNLLFFNQLLYKYATVGECSAENIRSIRKLVYIQRNVLFIFRRDLHHNSSRKIKHFNYASVCKFMRT